MQKIKEKLTTLDENELFKKLIQNAMTGKAKKKNKKDDDDDEDSDDDDITIHEQSSLKNKLTNLKSIDSSPFILDWNIESWYL